MRKLLIAISKHSPFMRMLRYQYVRVRNYLLWSRTARQPIEKRTIIFQAYSGRYTCSPKALYESMVNDPLFKHYTFIWVVSDKQRYAFLENQPRTSLVEIRTREYYAAFARAEYWVVNIMLPLRIIKRKSQVMVQCWHGTPLKRLRQDIVENTKNVMNSRQDFIRKNLIDTKRWDYLISPSRFATDKFVSAFTIQRMQDEGRILEIGYPRNDALHNPSQKQIDKLKRNLKLPKDKRVILYAPTWRDDQHDTLKGGYTHQNKLDFAKLQAAIGDKYVILFRAHYYIANHFDLSAYEGFVYDVSDRDDINDLYLVSDVLITDYSSVMFDYANTNKPMLFFMYDRQHYEENLRGFYIDIGELPGLITNSSAKIATALQDIKTYQQTYQKAYMDFSKRYTYLDDGKATKRLQAIVFSKLEPEPSGVPTKKTRTQPITQQGALS
jgi:CDP-glycerol glycerophosphotransferase